MYYKIILLSLLEYLCRLPCYSISSKQPGDLRLFLFTPAFPPSKQLADSRCSIKIC